VKKVLCLPVLFICFPVFFTCYADATLVLGRYFLEFGPETPEREADPLERLVKYGTCLGASTCKHGSLDLI
jgi:hypothetical protein